MTSTALLTNAVETYDHQMTAYLREFRLNLEEHPHPKPGDSHEIAALKAQVRHIRGLQQMLTSPHRQNQAA